MKIFRSMAFTCVAARLGVWTADLHILMPRRPVRCLADTTTAFTIRPPAETQEYASVGLVEDVEAYRKEILVYGRLTRGSMQNWHAGQMYLGREYIVPIFTYLDVEERTDGRRLVWDWRIAGFEVTRHPPWSDLPAVRVKRPQGP